MLIKPDGVFYTCVRNIKLLHEGKLRPNNHISKGYLGEKKIVREGLKETEMSVSKQKTEKKQKTMTARSTGRALAVTWQTAAPYGFRGLEIFLRAHSIVQVMLHIKTLREPRWASHFCCYAGLRIQQNFILVQA